MYSPGARANMDRDSPVEATAVTRARRWLKYCERMVKVGRKVRQKPRPEGWKRCKFLNSNKARQADKKTYSENNVMFKEGEGRRKQFNTCNYSIGDVHLIDGAGKGGGNGT